jgi:hypothetical protein
MERAHHGAARRAIADHATAVAALEPVGSEGWGRIMVKDQALADGGMRRVAAVHVLGLDPEVPYTVYVNGDVVLAQLETDTNGDARLQLSDNGDGSAPVPDDLPLAGELLTALVEDGTGAAVLQGDFVFSSHGFAGPRDLLYSERIELDPIDDFARRGIARVLRDGEDVQRFETRACGLEPGEIFEIRIDGVAAGQVTADTVGQAALELSTADVDNPLATDVLGEIEVYGLVEWIWLSQSAGDTIVLSGSFTGENQVGDGQNRGGNGADDENGRYGDGDNGQYGDGECDGECTGSGPNGGSSDENDNGQNGHQGDGSGDGDQNSHGGDADDDDENGHYGDGDGECDGSGNDGECDGSGSGN